MCVFFLFCLIAIRLNKPVGDQGADSVTTFEDPDLGAHNDDNDDDTGIVDERLGMVHSTVKLAYVPGTLSRF